VQYELLILPRAKKQLAALEKQAYEQIRSAIRDLASQPRPGGCAKLVGREGWRIRVGKQRVVYEVDDKAKTVTVVDIGHRRDVYRG
jgi:mRNA interferase RelE/StbE